MGSHFRAFTCSIDLSGYQALEMGRSFDFERVWTILMWFVVAVLILLVTLFIFFVVKNCLKEKRKPQSKPDHIDLVSVVSVTSDITSANEPKEEEEEEQSIDMGKQGNEDGSEGDPVLAADVHTPDV